jgi:hypothetical protein
VVDTELKITGRPAQFGRGVIQDVGGKLLDQFAACLATRLAEPAVDETAAATTGPASEAAGQAVTPEGPGPVSAAPAAEPAGPAASASAPFAPAPEPVELDLGGVVGPVLLKRLAPVGAGLVALLLLVRRLRRR